MATLNRFQRIGKYERINRYFSEEFKRKKVRELERNLTTIPQISREYEVSRTAIYKWINQYSVMRKKEVKQVVELKSDTAKIAHLMDQVKDMERLIGQKQIMVDFLEKMIEMAEKEYGVDIKKKFSTKRSSGSGSIGKSTGRK